MEKNQKKTAEKKGIEHTLWEKKTILEEAGMQMKKVDSPVSSTGQAYQVRNDRIFEVISGGHLREADWGKDGRLRA